MFMKPTERVAPKDVVVMLVTLIFLWFPDARAATYSFKLDCFEVEGNVLTSPIADDFSDGAVAPWVIYDPAVVESDSYDELSNVDPTGPESGQARVVCGGAWHKYAGRYRSAIREARNPSAQNRYKDVGFRVVLLEKITD